MAREPELPVISKKDISRNMEIPEQFLGKIAQQLSRAGIIEILQGARGGLRLLRAPVDISLLEVIEAVMGEIFLNDCIMSPQSCKRVPTCTVHQVWETAREGLRKTLGKADFEQLSNSTCNQ
jgi:Rrf2 family protein